VECRPVVVTVMRLRGGCRRRRVGTGVGREGRLGSLLLLPLRGLGRHLGDLGMATAGERLGSMYQLSFCSRASKREVVKARGCR
jgi:hypothetical protein